MVLESWYYTRRVVQQYSRNSLQNSRELPTGCCWAPIPQKAAEEVLEAWNYTRAAGTEVVHVAATGFQGIPDCVARYKFPRIWRQLDLIPTAARGVDTNGLRHLYQGSVDDGKRLEYWCSKFTRGH